MQLFKIGSKDFTSKITVPSYNVNGLPNSKEWKDGNHKTHRDVYGYKLKGNFTIYFDDSDEYFEFMSLIRDNTTKDGFIEVTLYDNTRNEEITTEVILSTAPANSLPYYGAKKHDGFNISIEER